MNKILLHLLIITSLFIFNSLELIANDRIDTIYTIHQNGFFSPIPGDGTLVSLSDDQVSAPFPIGFGFKFFGKTYTDFYISSNGFIAFNPNASNGCCSGQLLPNTSSPNNIIAFAWEDLNPGAGGTINYFTTGDFPKRKLVVNFKNVPHYGSNNTVTSQVILYEGTSIIEIHTQNMTSDGGYHTMGIENEDGTIAYPVPGRNASSWSVVNDYVSFVPFIKGANDAGVASINLDRAFCAGNQNVTAAIENYGNNIINNVTVRWMVNGVQQSAVQYSNPIDSINGTNPAAYINLGSRIFQANTSDTIIVWTDQPNNTNDTINFNDTIKAIVSPAIDGGTYTIGGTNPDFQSIQDAVAKMSKNGICGSVVFKLRSGTYNEQVRIPKINRSVDSQSITFESEANDSTAVVIAYSANNNNNYTIKIDEGENIIFRKLTIKALNNSNARVFDIKTGSKYISILNCVLQGISSPNAGDYSSVVYSSTYQSGGEAACFNHFYNNRIIDGSYGIFYNADGPTFEKGTEIINNKFENQSLSSIYLIHHDSVTIRKNIITAQSSAANYIGIYCANGQGSLKILENKLLNLNMGFAIYLYNCNGTSDQQGLIANNFIEAKSSGSVYGIYLDNSGLQKVYNNNIHIIGVNGIPLLIENATADIAVKNNILVNSGGGYTYYVSNSTLMESDYNDLFTTGSNIAFWDGDVATLKDLQVASNQDKHSLSVNPVFHSPVDLHVYGLMLNGSGIVLPEVVTDFDGEPRDIMSPDIGADEFTPQHTDASITDIAHPRIPFSSGNNEVVVVLKNFGIDTLRNAIISLEINGVLQNIVNWSGSLCFNDSASVHMGAYSFAYKNYYSLKCWSSLPNGLADNYNNNDTTEIKNIHPSMGGVFTIGGTNPDFTDFTSAVAALTDNGIASSVIFKVRNGSYNEKINIPDIIETSDSTTVTFESEPDDSSQVILSSAGTSTDNYVVQLNGANHITFREISIIATDPTYARVIVLTNNSNYNHFESNIIRGSAVENYSDNSAVIYSTNNYGSGFNSFVGNSVERGYCGIFYNGNAEKNILIEKNIFNNQLYYAIYAIYIDSLVIEGNTISSSASNSNYTPINCQSCNNNLKINKNRIFRTNGSYGISISSCYGSEATASIVSNNFINISGSGNVNGIYIYYTPYIKVYNNTVKVNSTGSSSNALKLEYCDFGSVNIINNILSNFSKGYAIYTDYPQLIQVSDYNDLYSKGPNIAYLNRDIKDLDALKSLSGKDSHSVSIDPLFISDNDLHSRETWFYRTGQLLPEITDDIDGELRDSLKPDIGAAKIKLYSLDAGIYALKNPQMPFLQNSTDITVILKNSGSVTLDSIKIDWTMNGIAQPRINWTGSLRTGDTTLLKIGNYPFILGQAYNIKCWISSPNGASDNYNSNDTILASNLYVGLAGIYTIGGNNPDFQNFQSAVDALIHGGIVDSVIFNVRNGTYNEQISIPKILGTSVTKTITFKSEDNDSTKVILSSYGNSSKNYTIQLNGTDHIRFAKMTLLSLDNNYARVIDISNNSTYNKFLSNIIRGVSPQYYSSYFANIFSSYNGNNSYNSFIRNRIENGAFGIYYEGSNGQRALVVEKNEFLNQYNTAMYFSHVDSLLITGNTIASNNASNSGYIGIYCVYAQNALSISGNKFYVFSGRGIYMYACMLSNPTSGIISNNFIYNCGTSEAIGISAYYCSYMNIYNNNINIASSVNNTNACLYFDYYCNNLNILNNILQNTNGYIIYSTYSNNNVTSSDYNDVLTQGPNWFYFGSVNYTSLDSWRTATNFDSHSLSVNPLFVSNTNLHVREISLKNAGIALPNVTDDIDGEPRNKTNPDIGADEFVITGHNDAGILSISSPKKPFNTGSQNISVVMQNYGIDSLKSATINWSINDILQTPFQWTGNMKSAEADTVTIGALNLLPYVSYNIKVWSTDPNGVSDNYNFNDTASVSNIFSALNGVYTIGGYGPDFNNFSQAISALKSGGITGPVTFNVRAGNYNEQLNIPAISGSSAFNTIKFRSENVDSTSVILSYNASYENYVIRLNGAKYVSFEKLTIESQNDYYNIVVDIQSTSNYNSFTNCVLISSNNSYYSNIYAYSVSCNGNRFINNRIENGYYGIEMNGLSQTNSISNIIIDNNKFVNQVRPVNLQYVRSVKIGNNEINSAVNNSSSTGIYVYYCTDSLYISGNRIYGSGYGISLYYCNGSSDTIVNNFISIGGVQAYGIYLYNSAQKRILFNTINITSTNQTSGAAIFTNWNSSNVTMINNIFANTGGGYCVYYEYNSGFQGISDYNDFFTTGSAICFYRGGLSHLANWRNVTGVDVHSLEIDPLFYTPDDLHILQPQLNNAGLSISSVKRDIDGEQRDNNHPDIGADEFTYHNNDLSIRKLVSPVSGCALSSSPVTVRIINYGGFPQKGCRVAYVINDADPVSETIDTTVVINPGRYYDYTFRNRIDISILETYIIKAYSILNNDENTSNDTISSLVTNYPIPGTAGNMLPVNGATGQPNYITFSWSPASNAAKYDVYIWQYGTSRPTTPTISNLSQITFTFNSALSYGTMYNWQVISKSDQCQTASSVQVFTVRELPDLIVNSVQVPASAYSGQFITVNWEVTNTGTGSTGSQQWIDAVYLSTDATLEKNVDTYLGGIGNLSALDAGQSYTQSATFALPNGISGNYYIFVSSNNYSSVAEVSSQNNVINHSIPITLTPPPDLKVTSIIIPGIVFSAQNINVTWTVKNDGSGATGANYWTDRIYITKDTIFTGSGTILGTFDHSGILNAGDSYITTSPVTIPDNFFGRYYIYVQTDIYNYVYEHANESNNILQSDSIHIILTPPPDLIVSKITVQDSAGTNQQINVEYNVENDGGSSTLTGYWTDRIYLSTSANNTGSVIGAMDFAHNGIINQGEGYTNKVNYTIPKGLAGLYYLYTKTDINNDIFEFNNENNNTTRSDKSIIIGSPDLTVDNISVPSTGLSGEDLNIQWTIRNAGASGVYTDKWVDRIMISKSATYDPFLVTELAKVEYYSNIPAGKSITRQQKVTLPSGLSGNYYLYVYTDMNNSVYESNEYNNINTSGQQISLAVPPCPDLQIDQVTVKEDTLTAGVFLNITFKISNKGAANTKLATWIDSAYISREATWIPSRAIGLRGFTITKLLMKDSSYTINGAAQIPYKLPEGNYYIYVFADASKNVFEYTNENNNVGKSKSLFIYRYPPVDLTVLNVQSPDSASSGKPIDIQWSVKNIGVAATFASSWIDALYLSKDTIWDSSDILVKEWTYSNTVEVGKTYLNSASPVIPNGIHGKYYLLLVSDRDNQNNDINLSNNYNTIRDKVKVPKLISINLTPSPDLVVDKFSGPSSGISGQPLTLKWTIKNKGVGPTVNDTWVERFYLSTDLNIDNNDIILETYAHIGILLPGASYSDTMVVAIPINAVGNYVLMVKTDNNNVEFEYNAENNNTAYSPVVINLPPPSDLIVSGIQVPDSALAGSNISISWTIKNIGLNPATGEMKDMIYLSSDNVWDINDIAVGSLTGSINLAPSGQLTRTINAELPGASIGKYYFVVRTDILDNISEGDNTNNTGVSAKQMKINVKDLPLNTWENDLLTNDKSVYYKIEIPGSLAGEALEVKLQGDSAYGKNEFYIRYNDMPTRVIYDYSHESPYQGNQDVVIPTLQKGTYYLMIYGNTSASTSQNIKLFAKKLNFELNSITANKGGNTGKVTVLVTGAKLDSTLQLKLYSAHDSINADKVLYINSVKVFATFDMKGKPLGIYNLKGTKANGESTELNNIFEVVQGTKPELQVNMRNPSMAVVGGIVVMNVEYSNSGNINLDSVLLNLRSLGTSPISFTINGLTENNTNLELPCYELNGPGTLLRPGARGSIVVYSKALVGLGFTIQLPNYK